MNSNDNALFDKITNSEDQMIESANIPRRKACTYLRAYIMASLCFEPYFVISDTSVNLNKAFRTLISYDEGPEYTTEDLPERADFDWLIQTGHIRFAARDKYKGNFSDALRISQKNLKEVDLPNEKYTGMINEICSDKYVYWYNLDKVSRMFSSNFRRKMDKELYQNPNLHPETAELLQKLIRRLSDEETFTYNEVKSILMKEYKCKKGDSRYRDIRRLLRESYDYNVPAFLKLDYCMPLRDIEPSKKQGWKLELIDEDVLDCNFMCNVYGLAKLPAHELKHIWDSTPGRAWQKQVNDFRAGIVDPDKYIKVLKNYLLEINEAVAYSYPTKSVPEHTDKKLSLSRLSFQVSHYVNADDIKVVFAKLARDAWKIWRTYKSLDTWIPFDVFFKILPNLVLGITDFPGPPTKVQDAIIMQRKSDKISTQ